METLDYQIYKNESLYKETNTINGLLQCIITLYYYKYYVTLSERIYYCILLDVYYVCTIEVNVVI